MCYVKVAHPGLLADFQEPAIFHPDTLITNITDKLLKSKICPGFVVGDIGEGEHPLWMRLRDSTSPVVGHCALVLVTIPAPAVERLNFACNLTQPVPGAILTIVS